MGNAKICDNNWLKLQLIAAEVAIDECKIAISTKKTWKIVENLVFLEEIFLKIAKKYSKNWTESDENLDLLNIIDYFFWIKSSQITIKKLNFLQKSIKIFTKMGDSQKIFLRRSKMWEQNRYFHQNFLK